MTDSLAKCPPSASNGFVNHLAFGIAVAITCLFVWHKPEFIQEHPLIFLLFYFVPVAVHECIEKKVYLKPSAGLSSSRENSFDPKRLCLKYLGLAVTLGVIAFLYWLFPEYRKDQYKPFFDFAEKYYLWIGAMTFIYVMIIDRFMRDAQDAYWQVGRLLTGKKDWNRSMVAEHFRSWFIRAFFLPAMFGFLLGDLNFVIRFDLFAQHDFRQYYDFFFNIIVIADLTAVVIGYAVVARIFDNNILSTDPTMKGWFFCLICYPPIWQVLFYNSYFAYANSPEWSYWLRDMGMWQYAWGMTILVFMALYASASLAFGLRWSNLTYRGIITSGTYKISKHPAYIFKNICWWLITMPFMISPNGSWQNSFKCCIMLLGINAIYFFRAKTEERHLSRYPEYEAYALWMERHGWFRILGKLCPWIKYTPHHQLPGKLQNA